MAELPYMPYVPSEYLGDTHHLTTLEHGAYHLLILNYWLRGEALPDDNDRLARIAKMTAQQWKKVRPILEEFFVTDGFLWQHKRIEMDLKRAREKVEQARAAGLASAKSRRRGGRRSNGRSNGRSTGVPTGVADPLQPIINDSINPLTPSKRSTKDASAPLGGQASSSSEEARSIGDILKGGKQ